MNRQKADPLFVGTMILAAVIPLVTATLIVLELRLFQDNNAPRELHAIAMLRRLYTAQQEFLGWAGRCGSLDELTQRAPAPGRPTFLSPALAPVTGDSAFRSDYYFRVHVMEGGAASPLGPWFAYAWPVSDPLCYRTFVIWSDGSIFGTSRYAGPLYPPSSCAFPAGSADDASLWYVAADGSEWRMVG